MNTFAVVLGFVIAVVGVRGTFSEDDQSYFKSKRGLTVVPAPSLAPAALAAQAYPAQAYAGQAYYPTAAVSPYFGVAKAAYLPGASLYSRPAPAYYAGTPAVAATGYAAGYPASAVVPPYSAHAGPGYSAPAVPGYSASAVPGYSVPAYAGSATPGAAYSSALLAAFARAPHLASSHLGSPHLASPQLAYSYYG